MKRSIHGILAALVAIVLGAAWPAQAQTPPLASIPGSGGDWMVNSPERVNDGKIEDFGGQQALWLRASTHVIKGNSRFRDGTIEFDLAPMEEGDFFAVTFRRESFTNHENVYFRFGYSEDFMSIQYAPRLNGSSTWQLYKNFNGTVALPRNKWTHVRLEVAGSRLRIYMGGAAEPALDISRLRHNVEEGEIGFWARVIDRPKDWAAAIANVRITPAASQADRIAAPPPSASYVTNWQISQPVNEFANILPDLSQMQWTAFTAEEEGLVNLNRVYKVIPNTRRTVFAKTVLRSAEARTAQLGIGYSDDVTVFLNGRPVYSGSNGWESRYPGFASFVDPQHERVWVQLDKGDNELILAVTDDQRFGWGLAVLTDPPAAPAPK